MNAPKIKCPDCDATFDKPGQLGPHRNKAHGYRKADGKSDPKRKAKGITIAQIAGRARLKGEFKCPDCKFVAKWKGGLSKHMQAIHPERAPFRCNECDARFFSFETLRKHHHRIHNSSAPAIPMKQRRELAQHTENAETITPAAIQATTATLNGHAPQDDRDHRLEAIATLATGRIQQVIEGLAFTHDLPPRSLTAYVIRTLGQASKVW